MVAKVFVRHNMEVAGAGFGDHVDHIAGAPSVLGRERVVRDLEFLNVVHRGHINGPAPAGGHIPAAIQKQAVVPKKPPPKLRKDMSWSAVSSAPPAVKICCCVWLFTEEFNITRPTTFLRLRGVPQLAWRRSRCRRWRPRFEAGPRFGHRHLFGSADGQTDVLSERVADIEDDPGLPGGFEALRACLKRVGADRQQGEENRLPYRPRWCG